MLGICTGHAQVQFGGSDGPIVKVSAGDVAILPAGTGHKRIDSSDDLLVVGGYPPGQEQYDLLRGDRTEYDAAEKLIAATPLPTSDPVFGDGGPLLEWWKQG